jgi:hypothetical protein
MGVPSQPLPTIGQPNSTEDAKVRSALSELQTILTAGVDRTNLSGNALGSAGLKPSYTLSSDTTRSWTTSSTTTGMISPVTVTPTVATTSLVAVMTNVKVTNGGSDSASQMAATLVLQLMVDGSAQTYQPTFAWQQKDSGGIFADSGMIGGLWAVPLTAGSHTVGLQGVPTLSVGGGVVGFSLVTNTTMLRLDIAT